MKDTRCSREEAAAFLEKDLKRAFRKGYTPKDLCVLLKKASIIIPERLIARYQELPEPAEDNRELKSEKQGGRDERNSIPPVLQTEDVAAAKDIILTSQNAAMTKPKLERLFGMGLSR